MWDWDFFRTDELIGGTTIDLSDRFFCEQWNALPEKPIEERSLYNTTSKVEMGKLRCWVEIYPKSTCKASRLAEPVLISQQPKEKFEGRVIVYTTEDMPLMDVEGTTDIYVAAMLAGSEWKETDTHWRSQNGFGSFNWRMKFNMEFPLKEGNCMFTLQAWDKDLIGRNELIGEAQFNF